MGRFALLALMLSACGRAYIDPGPISCIDVHGVSLSGSDDCTGLASHLDRTLEAFGQIWSTDRMRGDLSGLTIKVMPGAFTDPGDWGNETLYGLDVYDEGLLEVLIDPVDVDWRWNGSDIPHELAHQFQWDLDKLDDPTHATWDARGIWPALTNVLQPKWKPSGPL